MYDELKRSGRDDKRDRRRDERKDKRNFQRKDGTGMQNLGTTPQAPVFLYAAIAAFLVGAFLASVHYCCPDLDPQDRALTYRFGMIFLSSSIMFIILLLQQDHRQLQEFRASTSAGLREQGDDAVNETENTGSNESGPEEKRSQYKKKNKKKRKSRSRR